jgi:hypothetical protein
MEEGDHKSESLSYTVKCKHEVGLCAEGKGNCKANAVLGVDEKKTFGCGRNMRQGPASVRCHEIN